MWINYGVRAMGIMGIAGLPLFACMPCYCCVPSARRTIATMGCAWVLAYVFLMTAGPHQTAGWIAWFFTEMWLSNALIIGSWAVYYALKVLGIVLSNGANMVLCTLFIWGAWNLYVWLQRRAVHGAAARGGAKGYQHQQHEHQE